MIPDPMLAKAVADTYRAMLAAGLNRGASGNVSARCGDGFLITPSGRAATDTDARDIVPVGLDGEPCGAGRPSSEWRIHRDLYRARTEVNAVVHAHSPFAVSLAVVYRSFCKFRLYRRREVLSGGRPGRVAPGAAAQQSGAAVA